MIERSDIKFIGGNGRGRSDAFAQLVARQHFQTVAGAEDDDRAGFTGGIDSSVRETFLDRGHIGFTTGCLASTISHMRIAAKSGKAIENYLGVSRAFASPLGLTCRKMCPSVFLPMDAYAYA